MTTSGDTPAGTAGAVLVVDDDVTVRDVVRRYLELAGYTVALAGTGQEALRAHEQRPADLVVLDLMLPDLDGLEVCRRIRGAPEAADVPVVMLTALGEEENRIAGLQLGADDYVTKPFSPRELALRVTSVLRRTGPVADARVVTDGPLTLNPAARTATADGAGLALTTREFDLLWFFLTHPGTAFTRDELLERVWGWDFGDRSTVTVHVRRLREKIERVPAEPARITTVWGVGYRYDAGSAEYRTGPGS
ncbi:response regulator transcription factor [Prauserella halophila]|uniref:Response regulator transcription factor n=1 Tax=Prauserella halophila TaxID=185641 RepID=A0ABP4GJ56_9PSEU|nr:response regulator transcription factor [Prauserella halophila]MCP2237337.1 DNA-binding response regulator, OmpR family, contains REC and winged-helix (wHTH) domain [Prauserella halophila]